MAGRSQVETGGKMPSVRDISLSIQEKSLNLLSGEDPEGKNLLLLLLGLLEAPDEGDIFFRGEATRSLPEELRAEIRNQHFGFLFSQPYLLPSFSVVENVAMPLFKVAGVDAQEAQRRTQQVLDFVGMEDRAEALADQLPYAQQYRISLARALVNHPEILIIENLDAEMCGGDFAGWLELMKRASVEFGTATIFTAKNPDVPGYTGRIIELAGGVVTHDTQAIREGGAAV